MTTPPFNTSPRTSDREVLNVGQLNRLARQLLEECFPAIWVEGEISNLSQPASGHWYFTLKDDQAQVRCAMFRNRNFRLRFRPANGARIILRGKLSLYENRGDYQLIVDEMQPAGEGLLAVRFQALKQRLQEEGLFDPTRKRPLPPTPLHIAVVTSPSGAAIRDILTVLRRRCPGTRVTVVPVPVQGDQAAPAIVRALSTIDRLVASGRADFDTILISRGGGSLEDLWPFNEEAVARAIVTAQLPVVSAVGHEVDTTISDLVADQRAPTPSAAAELLSPDCAVWLQRLGQCDGRLQAQWHRQLQAHRQRLVELRQRLQHPGQRLQQRALRIDELEARLSRCMKLQLTALQSRAELLNSRLLRVQPGRRIEQLQARLEYCRRTLPREVRRAQTTRATALAQLAQLLHGVSPLATLQRGYAIVTDSEGAVVRSAADAAPGSRVIARLGQGTLVCAVKEQLIDPPASPPTPI